MKKIIIAVITFLLAATAVVLVYQNKMSTKTEPAATSSAEIDREKKDIRAFFDYAKENIPVLTKEITEIKRKTPDDAKKIEHLEDNLKTYKLAKVIADIDIEALKGMTLEELETNGQIWVPADRFKDQMKGLLASRIIAGQNAIAYVLFYSATNKTEEDNKKTLEMLQILLDKKLNPNALASDVYWVKNKPEDEWSLDYVGQYSLVGAALIYSFPEALELLLKNGAVYSDGTMQRLEWALEHKLPYAKEFEKILSRYKSQKVTQEEAEKRMSSSGS